MFLARNIVFLISRPLMLGGIVGSCGSFEITALTSIKVAAVDRLADQDPVLLGPALVQAAQVLAIKAKETMEVIINSLAMEVSNKTTSPGIRVTQNSLMEANIMFLRQALTSGIRRCASGQLVWPCRLSRST
jgi:hypothetical protein